MKIAEKQSFRKIKIQEYCTVCIKIAEKTDGGNKSVNNDGK